MNREDVEDLYTLSPMQQGMLFQSLSQAQPGMYFEQGICTLRGNLNLLLFEQAWRQVLQRQQILRTAFVWEGLSKPIQAVHRKVELPVEHHDWRELPFAEQQAQMAHYLQANRQRGIDLTVPPLMRLAFIRTANDAYQCVWGIHHLIHDAWSTFVLLREVLTIYEALTEGRSDNLQPSRPFRDYVVWLKGHDLSEAETYWRQMLQGFSSPTPLMLEAPGDNSVTPGEPYNQQESRLPVDATTALNAFARQHHLTLNTVALGAWAILLSRYCGRRDIVFGIVVSGRSPGLDGVESIVGPLLNTLPVRVRLSGEDSLLPWLKELQAQQLKLREFEHVPLRQIQSWSDVPKSLPLFESLLVFQNAFGDVSGQQPGQLKIEDVRSVGNSNFPFSLRVTPRPELWLEALYDVRRFDLTAVNKLLEDYQELLCRMAAQPHARMEALLEAPPTVGTTRPDAESKVKRNFPGTKLSSVKPKATRISAEELVKKSCLQPGQTLPLVVEPNDHEVDLISWTRTNREAVEKELLRHGGVLFRNFDVSSVATFEQFVKVISPELLEYRERSTPRTQLGGNVYTSTEYPAHQEIAFHNEFSYAYTWPMKICFHCVEAPTRGGETPIADSRRVWQLLTPAVRNRFIEKNVMYVRNYGTGIDLTWEEAFQTTDRTAVEQYCRNAPMDFEWGEANRLRTRQVRPATARHPKTGEMLWFNQAHLFHVSNLAEGVRESMLGVFREDDMTRNAYYGDGSVIEDAVLDEIREAYREAATVFSWQAGDVLLLDNMLTAHGRTSFEGVRQIIVAMAEPFTTSQRVETRGGF